MIVALGNMNCAKCGTNERIRIDSLKEHSSVNTSLALKLRNFVLILAEKIIFLKTVFWPLEAKCSKF